VQNATAKLTPVYDPTQVRRVLDLHAPLRTSRRRCGQHDNSIGGIVMTNCYVVDSSVGTVGLDFCQTSRPTTLLVRLHVTASSDRALIASSPKLMKYRETSALSGEQHRDSFTASARPFSSLTTINYFSIKTSTMINIFIRNYSSNYTTSVHRVRKCGCRSLNSNTTTLSVRSWSQHSASSLLRRLTAYVTAFRTP